MKHGGFFHAIVLVGSTLAAGSCNRSGAGADGGEDTSAAADLSAVADFGPLDFAGCGECTDACPNSPLECYTPPKYPAYYCGACGCYPCFI